MTSSLQQQQKDTENSLAQLFYLTGQAELQFEDIRTELFNIPNFSAEKAFKLIDNQNKGLIDTDQLRAFLKNYAVIWDYKEAQLFIDEFDDIPKDGRLSIVEFERIIETLYYLPQTNSIDNMRSQRSQMSSNSKRDMGIKMAKLIESYYLHILQKNQFKLQNFEKMTDQDLFNVLDLKNRKGYLSDQDIEDLLAKHRLIDLQSHNSQLLTQQILKRVDRDQNQQISFEDFKQFLNHIPLSVDSYRQKQEEFKNSIQKINITSQLSQESEPSIRQKKNVKQEQQQQQTVFKQQQQQQQTNNYQEQQKGSRQNNPRQNTQNSQNNVNQNQDQNNEQEDNQRNARIYSPMRYKQSAFNQSRMMYEQDQELYLSQSSPQKQHNPSIQSNPRQTNQESPAFGSSQQQLRINEDSPEKKRLDEQDASLKLTFSKQYFDERHHSNTLLDYLLKVVNTESSIEEKREQCAQQTQFNLYETFRYFDVFSRGYIYAKDVLKGMHELGLKETTDDDIMLLYKRYDTDQDGTIRFSEFSHIFEPINEDSCEALLERKPASLEKEFKEFMFTYQGKKALTEFLSSVIQGEREHKQFRQIFKQTLSQDNIGFKNLYDLIQHDKLTEDYVSEESLVRFMNECEVMVTGSEIKLLYKIFDRNRDGLINFDEFFGVLNS
ncbi:ef hand family protein [Stylonychia lemnae]|uniref:Ef hand family protein n=1 Tax=Stylonychia lemnae TaxID=5949 RepID=A0A078ANN0_STYLE|nr:ef hand family protein [Stylonychia lemnae]|eukprot:CDW82573.1 ef hand family protein [Stylonychia lemnae]